MMTLFVGYFSGSYLYYLYSYLLINKNNKSIIYYYYERAQFAKESISAERFNFYSWMHLYKSSLRLIKGKETFVYFIKVAKKNVGIEKLAAYICCSPF